MQHDELIDQLNAPGQARANKERYARIDRDEVVEIMEDENSHLWAVAYSDLLMVLLSFFILFYSTETHQRENLLMNLARGLATEVKSTPQQGASDQHTKSMYADLKQLNISIVQEKENLTLNFSNELFKPGKFHIQKNQEIEIVKVLDVIAKYKDQINIYFEGHADSTPVLHGRNKIIQDNFVLSSLRATQALQLAKKQGFPERHLFAQASSSNTRNSRSLSLRIEPIVVKAPTEGQL